MYKIVRNLTLLIVVAVLCMHQGCSCPGKYAVLVSTNNITSDDASYHSTWWYDLVDQYKMLLDNGFSESNIYVLYGNGTDFASSHKEYNTDSLYSHSITDLATNRANIQSIFQDTLPSKIDSDDFLYVWWMGHGSGSGTGSCDLGMTISHTFQSVSDSEFVDWMDSIGTYSKRVVAIMTCHSGGMVNNLNTAGDRTTLLTSSTCTQSSYDANSTCDNIVHAEFNYTVPNAMREQDPCGTAVASDSDGNDSVSIDEVHQYNAATMTTSTPQMEDPDAQAGTTYLIDNSP